MLDSTAQQYFISAYDGAGGGSPVTLRVAYSREPTVDVAYQWYICGNAQGQDEQPIKNAYSISYDTDVFDAAELRYYFCEVSYTDESAQPATRRTPVFHVAYTGLPTLYINTDGSEITRENYIGASLTLVPNADYPKSAFADMEITIKGRGNSSWGMPKKGYNFKFSKKQDLFGLGKDKKWSLIANYADKTLLRNWFSSELSEHVFQNGGWQPSYIPVDFILNGNYVGTYTLVNSIKISESRVDIPDIADKLKDDVNGDESVDLNDGGFILEVDARYDASHYFATSRGVPVTLKDPDLDDAPEGQFSEDEIFTHIQSHVQKVEDILYSDGFADPAAGYRKYLDVDSFVQWYLVNELTKNNDARFFTSVYMYFDPGDGLIHMGPNWDFDISSGNIDYNNCDDPAGFWIKNANWISRMFLDPYFVDQVCQAWNDSKSDLLSAVNQAIQAKANSIKASAQLNFERWPILGTYVWPNAPGYEERTTYQSEVNYLVSWLNRRIEWMDGALNALNAYTVTWQNEDKSILERDENVAYGAMPSYDGKTPEKTPDAGHVYTFDHWSPEVAAVAGTAVYTAVYREEARPYTIRFVGEDGTELSSASYAYGTGADEIKVPEAPAKEGTAQTVNTFSGWTPEITDVTSDATYTATYVQSPRRYSVYFVNDDTTRLSVATYPYGTAAAEIVLPETPQKAPDREKTYTFAGWDPQIADVTGEVTYKAVYTASPRRYLVQFVNEDGTELSGEFYDYGMAAAEIVRPGTPQKNPTVENVYIFDRWDTEILDVEDNATYTAVYREEARQYTIRFVDEDGKELSSASYVYGTAASDIALPAVPESKADAETVRVFAGWFPEMEDVDSNATYVAVYKEVPRIAGEVSGSAVSYTARGIPDGAKLIAARYDGGRMTDLQIVNTIQESGSVLMGGSGDEFKLFLVGELFIPLCEPWSSS
ncbi:MAG: CotH kinase family protein [Oscillospiraceae bacterium]|nr:CotH kinase family protein [Oscillospiraceae bacterium]